MHTFPEDASCSTKHPVRAPSHPVMPRPQCPLIRYLQLATVQPDGRPANRTVVFRWDSYRPPRTALPCTALLVPPASCRPSCTALLVPPASCGPPCTAHHVLYYLSAKLLNRPRSFT